MTLVSWFVVVITAWKGVIIIAIELVSSLEITLMVFCFSIRYGMGCTLGDWGC